MRLDDYVVDIRRRIDIIERTTSSLPAASLSNWVTPASLSAGWSNYLPGSGWQVVQYCRDTSGFVHIRGNPTGPGGTLFTLPAGFRPAKEQYGLCATNGSAASAWRVTVAGVVTIELTGGASAAPAGLNIFFPASGAPGASLAWKTGVAGISVYGEATFGTPTVYQHRSGMCMLSGMLQGGSSPVVGSAGGNEVVFNISSSLFLERVSLINGISAGGHNRYDIGGGVCRYRQSGGDGGFFSLNTMIWPGPKTDKKWTPLTLMNGWVAYGGEYQVPAYYRDSSGWVHLKGLVAGGTATANTVVANLPAGPPTCRPPAHVFNRAAGWDGTVNSSVICSVNSDGNVALQQSTNNAFFSLDGLHFHTTT